MLDLLVVRAFKEALGLLDQAELDMLVVQVLGLLVVLAQ